MIVEKRAWSDSLISDQFSRVTTGYVSQVATGTSLINSVATDSTSLALYGTGAALAVAVLLLGIGFGWSRMRKKGVGAKKF